MQRPEIEEVLRFAELDEEALRKGKQRQGAVAKNEDTDYLPLLLEDMPVSEKEQYCRADTGYCQYNRKEQFYDKRKMLFEQLWGLVSTARSKSDAQPAASVDLGAGFVPSILGLEQIVFEDKDPWLQERLSKQEITQLAPGNLGEVSRDGLMPRALEYVAYFRETLGKRASVCIYPDILWGPFSVAHLIRGDDLFTDLHDDPGFVHHLMEVASNLYVRCASILKKAIGELNGETCQGGFYLSNSGVWSNEDTAVLVSPSQAEEFVFPYLRKAYAPFGGAVVHFCGRADHLLEPLLELPEVKGINLGEPEWQKLSWEEIMKMVLSKGKAYYGHWPRKEGESTSEYFTRMLEPLEGERRGLVLTYGLTKGEQENPGKVMDIWHSLQ